jgi:hypothetical protein
MLDFNWSNRIWRLFWSIDHSGCKQDLVAAGMEVFRKGKKKTKKKNQFKIFYKIQQVPKAKIFLLSLILFKTNTIMKKVCKIKGIFSKFQIRDLFWSVVILPVFLFWWISFIDKKMEALCGTWNALSSHKFVFIESLSFLLMNNRMVIYLPQY